MAFRNRFAPDAEVEPGDRKYGEWKIDLKNASDTFTNIRKNPLALKQYIDGWADERILPNSDVDAWVTNSLPAYTVVEGVAPKANDTAYSVVKLWHQGIVEKCFINKNTLGPLVLPPYGLRNINYILSINPNPNVSEKGLILQPRRTLKTFTVAAGTFLYIMKYPLNPEVLIVSHADVQAEDLIRYLDKSFAECPFPEYRDIIDNFLKPVTDWRNNKIVFTGLPGKSSVFTRNAYTKKTQKNIRSSHVGLILVDEADQLKHEVIQDLDGNLELGQKMIALTTPDLDGSWTQRWYMAYVHKYARHLMETDPYTKKLMEGYRPPLAGYDNITVFRTPIREVIDNPGRSDLRFYTWDQVRDMEAVAMDNGTYNKFRADVKVEWSTGDDGPMFQFGLEHNYKNYIPPHPLMESSRDLSMYYNLIMGVDVGLSVDSTVIFVLGTTRDPKGDEEVRCLYIEEIKKDSSHAGIDPELPSRVVKKVIDIGTMYGCFTVVFDEHGQSSPVHYHLERTKMDNTDPRIDQFTFIEGKWGSTPDKKYESFTKLLSTILRKKLFFPSPQFLRSDAVPAKERQHYQTLADNVIMTNTQLLSMCYVTSPSGKTLIKSTAKHDDYACALAFALSALDSVDSISTAVARTRMDKVGPGEIREPSEPSTDDPLRFSKEKANAEHFKFMLRHPNPEMRERYEERLGIRGRRRRLRTDVPARRRR